MANSELQAGKKGLVLFELRPDAARPTRVINADYAREFDEQPPWMATAEEWERFLLPTGLFREAKPAPQARASGAKKE